MTGLDFGPAAVAVAALLALLPPAANAGADGNIPASQPAAAPSQQEPSTSAPVDWLERAARVYQEEIAARLAVPRENSASETASGESFDRAPGGFVGALRRSMETALAYISFWVQQANAALGGRPTELAYGIADTPAERSARDADQFVAARRVADEQWKRAVARADAAAAAQRAAPPDNLSAETPAEAELRRAEARKAELAKIKQDLDRRISEGLKKLEEFQRQEQERQKLGLLTPDVERSATTAEKTHETAKAERARAEAQAAQKAKDAERAEQALKQKQAELAEKAEQERRQSAAKAEQERLAKEEARKLAAAELAARKAEEARIREAQAAEEKRQADAKAEAARAAEAARVAEEARRAEQVRVAEDNRARAEREAAEQQRRSAEEAEQARKAQQAQEEQQAKLAEQARVTQERQRWAEARAVQERRPAAEAKTPSEPKVAASQPAESQATQTPDAAPAEKQPSTVEKATRAAKKKPDAQSIGRKKKLASSRTSRNDVAGRRDREKTARKTGKRIHVVARGETLWGISQRYLKNGERYGDIRKANGRKIRNPDLIYPRQRLLLPARA